MGAYDSLESGRFEIYVRPFPPADRTGKWQVSGAGGQQPRWRSDGRELFYLAPGRALTAVDVETRPNFQAGTPHGLFNTPFISGNSSQYQYDVTRDGKRFVMMAPSVGAASTPATVVENWQETLKK